MLDVYFEYDKMVDVLVLHQCICLELDAIVLYCWWLMCWNYMVGGRCVGTVLLVVDVLVLHSWW